MAVLPNDSVAGLTCALALNASLCVAVLSALLLEATVKTLIVPVVKFAVLHGDLGVVMLLCQALLVLNGLLGGLNGLSARFYTGRFSFELTWW